MDGLYGRPKNVTLLRPPDAVSEVTFPPSQAMMTR